MILFYGTKKVGTQTFLVFKNENDSFVNIPVDENIKSLFLHHFNRLSAGVKDVEKG